MKTFAGIVVAAAAALAATAGPADGQQGCVAKQVVGTATFDSRVCDMPDYDQRRRARVLAGSGQTFNMVGLEGDGGCHCVPTALTDLLGYYAHKGVDIPPRSYGWWTRAPFDPDPNNDFPMEYLSYQPYPYDELVAHNRVSILVRDLGESVEVDGDSCGTSYADVVDSFGDLAADGKFNHALLGFGITDTGKQAGRDMAGIMYNGGLVSAAFGRYEDYERDGTEVNVGSRAGGHALAVTGLDGSVSTFDMDYHDPNSGGDLFRQAQFQEVTRNLLRLRDVKAVGSDDWLYRLGADSGGETQNLLDKYMAVYPQILVATKGDHITIVFGHNLNRQSGDAEPLTQIVQAAGKVIDAVVLPLSGEVAYIEQGSQMVKAVVPGTGHIRTLGRAPAGKRDLEASPTGKLVFALGDGSVRTLSRAGGVIDRRKLDGKPSALAYDWSEDRPWKQRLGVVSEDDRRLALLDPRTLKTTDRASLPRRLLRGKGRLTAGFSPGGRLQIRLGDGSVRTRGGRAQEPAQAAPGFATADDGTLITTRGKRVDAGRLAFDGVDIGGARITAISHSGGDYSRAEADQFIDATSLRSAPPPEPEPEPTPTPTPTPTATPAPRPNLVIASAGDERAVIRNAGDAPAGPFTATLTRGRSEPQQVRFPNGLAAGASTAFGYSCRRETRTLTVDPTDAIAESGEDDNVLQFTTDCL
jgi:hypothetical protein